MRSTSPTDGLAGHDDLCQRIRANEGLDCGHVVGLPTPDAWTHPWTGIGYGVLGGLVLYGLVGLAWMVFS